MTLLFVSEAVYMAEQSLVQFRVDNELKRDVSEIYEAMGLDLPTALRMFMARSRMVRGIPFDTTLPDNVPTRAEALKAFNDIRSQSAELPEMTLEDINAEISAARAERKAKQV
jgi:DNA-damage-inducible protein J